MRFLPAPGPVALGAVLAACGVAAACSLVSGETGAPPDPGEAACAEVRAGVDAFNAGDFEEAVARFRAAVPPAEERAERTPSARADLLLEAVEWYAALPPEDYPRASRRSEQFARYRAVTLAQCVVGEPGEDPPGEDPPGEDPPGEDPPGEDPPDEDESDRVTVQRAAGASASALGR